MINLDERTITAEVRRRIAETPDRRLRTILTSLLRHLHAVRRVVEGGNS